MIDVNMKGTLYGIAGALPHMKRQKSGHVINVSSVYGHKVSDIVNKIGVPASTMASMVAVAISQPDDVDVNEILFRPTVQPV